MSSPVRTRFAPSPTGYLHIGGVRTALFNWLVSRRAGDDGRFILRIDDTDAARNVDAALQPILDGFRWLGMDWDEGPEVGGPHEPYYQSRRSDRYAAAVEALLASGHAYRDYARPEELAELRSEAEKNGERFFYDRRFMAADDDAAAAYEAEGRPRTVRLKMPREGDCVIDDLIRGEVRVAWSGEQDHVIQRPDGSAIYHLASAVDDHDLGITHVIRAQEHLSNTPRQVFILESLGHPLPAFAHLPYVAEPGGSAKLSKRKLAKYEKNPGFADLLARGRRIAEVCGLEVSPDTFNPVIVDFYRDTGFDPAAVLNYLLLVGWSLDGEREKFTVPEMIEHFTLDRVNKAPASFDPQKLLSFAGDAFNRLPLDERVERCRPFAASAGWIGEDDFTGGADARFRRVVELAGDRIKIAGDIVDFDYCFTDDYWVDDAAVKKHLRKDPAQAAQRLGGLVEAVSAGSVADADAAKAAVMGYVESQGLKLKDVVHLLRVATTGRAGGFGMFDTLAVLGQNKVLERLTAAQKPVA